MPSKHYHEDGTCSVGLKEKNPVPQLKPGDIYIEKPGGGPGDITIISQGENKGKIFTDD